jgi:AcrR family transcriptional regulator
MFKLTTTMEHVPRETLTRDQIVQTAVDLLDAEGVDGTNMRALGERLGHVATAVYWHVSSKDDLIVLAGDHVWTEIALPKLGALDWRTVASQMAADLYAMLCRHPWLVQAFGSNVMYGPNKASYDDHALAIYETAGFSPTEADQAVAAIFTFVLGNALGLAAATSMARKLNRQGAQSQERARDSMAKARQIAAQFPRLAARLGSPAAEYATSPENTFEVGLRALLDGLDAQLSVRRAAADPKRRGPVHSP